MKEFILGLVAGIVLTAVTGWYYVIGQKNHHVQKAQVTVGSRIQQAVDAMSAKIDAFQLSGKDIKDDLAHTGKVVRQSVRSVGNAIGDATGDTRITATIKAKLIKDSELSAWKIDVSTTDGLVTLSGTVSTHEQIGRAMLVALETPGVSKVSSTLQVKQ